jgi:hypothetical protein
MGSQISYNAERTLGEIILFVNKKTSKTERLRGFFVQKLFQKSQLQLAGNIYDFA